MAVRIRELASHLGIGADGMDCEELEVAWETLRGAGDSLSDIEEQCVANNGEHLIDWEQGPIDRSIGPVA
jgi:hypothetical protein